MATLTICKNFIGSISYPPPPKKPYRCPPLSTPQSKLLIQQYRDSSGSSGRKLDARRNAPSGPDDANNKPSSPQDLIEQGKEHIARGNFDSALTTLLQCLRRDSENFELYELIGDVYGEKEMFEDSLNIYTKGVEKNPINTILYKKRAECYLQLDQFGAAAEEFEKYLKMEIPDFELLVKVGKTCIDANKLERAEQLLLQAQKMNNNDSYLAYNLGELYERQGDKEKSKELYSSVMHINPEFPIPYIKQAEEELSYGHLNVALHIYESLSKILPQNSSIYMKCSDIYLQLGVEYSVSALNCLNKAIQLSNTCENRDYYPNIEEYLPHPLTAAVYIKRGGILFDKFSDLTNAISDFTIAISMTSDKLKEVSSLADALVYRASCFRELNELGNMTDAMEDYERFVQLDVDLKRKAVPYLFLAEYFFEKREYAKAANYYILSWQSNPSFQFHKDKVSYALLVSRMGNIDVSDKSHFNAIPPLWLQLFESYYLTNIKALEPSVFSETVYQFKDLWMPLYDEVLKKRDEQLKERAKRTTKK